MAFCNNCQHQFPASKNKLTEATKRLWCPTWLTSEKGPIDLCEECAKTFMPEHNNTGASDGSWHWGDEADAAFASVELNVPYTDEHYENAKRMAMNGTKVANIGSDGVYVVDGKAWLVARFNVLRLGDFGVALERFPKLFEKRV